MEKVLPKGWTLINLKEAVISVKGKKPAILNGEPFDHSLPYMDIFALERGEVRQFADIRSAKSFNNGAIAMVWDGARSGWVSKANYGAIGSTICAIYPKNFSSDYLFYFLLNEYPVINSNSRGVGIPHVDPTYLWNLKLPLPPLPEQERIVAKLDLLFGQLERIKSRLTKIPAILKTFRQQVLTQAVTGKLTNVFVKNAFLADFLTDVRYGTSKKSEYDNDGKPILRIPNICEGRIDSTNLKYSLLDDKEYDALKLKVGDILIIRSNGSRSLVGQRALVTEGFEGYCYAGYLIRLRLNDGLLPIFFNYQLGSSYLRNQIVELSRSTNGINNINSNELKGLKILVPSVLEQQKIVNRIESLFAKADVIEEKYKNLKTKIENLPQAILHKAFKGELVEQLPTDGDAQDLLNEIKGLPAMAAEESAAYEKSKPKLKNRILNEPDLD